MTGFAVSPVTRFLARVLVLLPACFALWYLTAPYWLYPLWAGLDSLMPKFLPSLLSGVERHGHLFEVITRVTPSGASAALQGAVITFEVNPLSYAYSLPLYTGLVLAAPTRPAWRKVGFLGIGLLILAPALVWGASFDILKTLVVTLAADTAPYAGFSRVAREFIVWADQFGYLVLPGVLPLAIWIGLHRDFLRELAPALERAEEG
jgi:hypothetical protein